MQKEISKGFCQTCSTSKGPAAWKPDATLLGKHKQSLTQRSCNSSSLLPLFLRGTHCFRERTMLKVNSGTKRQERWARLRGTVFCGVEERFERINTGVGKQWEGEAVFFLKAQPPSSPLLWALLLLKTKEDPVACTNNGCCWWVRNKLSPLNWKLLCNTTLFSQREISKALGWDWPPAAEHKVCPWTRKNWRTPPGAGERDPNAHAIRTERESSSHLAWRPLA